MKDGALLIVVAVIVVVGAVWLLPHIGASNPPPSSIQSPPQLPDVVVRPREDVKHSRGASSDATLKGESKPVKPHASEEPPVIAATVPRSEVRRAASIIATAAPRFPAVDQVRVGADKPQIKEMFGDPALSAMTTNLGHDRETFVYARDRGQAVTVICFEDGKVTGTTPQRPPFSPTNLQATAISPTQVKLTWTNNAEDATAVLVELETIGSSARFDLGQARTLTDTTVTNLPPNRSYTFRVRAQNSAGYSGYSKPATVTPAKLPDWSER